MVAMNEKNCSDVTTTRFEVGHETVIASAYCRRHEAAPQWTSECGHGLLKRVSGCTGPAAHSRMPLGTLDWGRSMEPDMGRYGPDPLETPTVGLQLCVSSLCCSCAQAWPSSLSWTAKLSFEARTEKTTYHDPELRSDGGPGRFCYSRELA